LYAKLSGRDLSALPWYVAFAYFKLGVIIQQICFRWFNGQTHDERFEGHGRVAVNLIRKAASVAGITTILVLSVRQVHLVHEDVLVVGCQPVRFSSAAQCRRNACCWCAGAIEDVRVTRVAP
jgi:hypothetical protein